MLLNKSSENILKYVVKLFYIFTRYIDGLVQAVQLESL